LIAGKKKDRKGGEKKKKKKKEKIDPVQGAKGEKKKRNPEIFMVGRGGRRLRGEKKKRRGGIGPQEKRRGKRGR